MEFKGTKEEKALIHAQKCWGIYFDDVDEDCIVSRGEASQQDYLAGYEQALKDTKAPEMLEILNTICCELGGEQYSQDELEKGLGIRLASLVTNGRKLIKQATEL